MTPNSTVPAFVPIKDDKSLVRDTRTGALLQTDRAALDRHRAARAKALSLVQRVSTLERELAELKSIVSALGGS